METHLLHRWFARRDAAPSHPHADGRPASTPPGERLYAIGDIHGRLDLLARLEDAIADELRARPPRGPVRLVYVGDYVDRGPDSKGVLDRLARAAARRADTSFLLGNHDLWFRAFLDGGEAASAWLGSGGDVTLASYGLIDLPALGDTAGWARARTWLHRRMPASHRRFLAGLQPGVRHGDYFFAHAGIRPGLPIDRQERRDLVFIREPFLSDESDLGVVVVHGHTVGEAPVVRRNRIGIDTGAYWTGRLTAVVLEDQTLRFLQTTP